MSCSGMTKFEQCRNSDKKGWDTGIQFILIENKINYETVR